MPDRLYRSRSDRLIGGVAGGVAEALNVDSSIVRVVWVILALVTGGLAAVVYLVMLVVVPEGADRGWERREGSGEPGIDALPEEPATEAVPVRSDRAGAAGSNSGALVFGLLLILVGAYFLLRRYLPALDLDVLWPIVVIVLGVLLVFRAVRPDRRQGG